MNGAAQTYILGNVNCLRLQNLPVLKTFDSKKRSIYAKNIPTLPSTQTLRKGGIDSIMGDANANEFYLWHFSAKVNEVMRGEPLKLTIDANS